MKLLQELKYRVEEMNNDYDECNCIDTVLGVIDEIMEREYYRELFRLIGNFDHKACWSAEKPNTDAIWSAEEFGRKIAEAVEEKNPHCLYWFQRYQRGDTK